ncbi:MAG: DUF58 domain-containing protein, partial [Defluviitaleaceae bacterium]|nr:DUF58 domain-containing protein [Defluviitaleaceae bacterium]
LYAVLALPLLSLVLTFVSRRRFTVEERITQDNIIKGETVQYVFNVRNNSFLPYTSVRVRFKANSSAVTADFTDQFFAIWPYKNHELTFNLSAKYRGNYEIGVLNIMVYDFLGLFSFEQKHKHTFFLTVRPRVLDIMPLPLSKADSGTENVKNFTAEEDYALISDLRKYQPTDGYKKIHWKASAKRNELVSKNYQNTKRNSVALLVDNSLIEAGIRGGDAAAAMEDLMMEAYVSALSYCIKSGYVSSLFFMGDEQHEGAIGNFEYLYTIASKINFGDAHSNFDAYIVNYSKMQADAENVIIFVQEINDAVFATAQTLHVFGNNIIIFYFKDPHTDETAKITRFSEMNIHCLDFRQIVNL